MITSATEVGNTRPSASRPEAVAKIHEVGFYSLSSSNWDSLSTYDAAPSPTFAEHADALLRDSYSGQSTPNSATLEHPCMPLTKIISAGTFYYSLAPYWDLSSRLSQRVVRDEKSAQDTGHFDDRFIWNEYIVRSLLDFRDRLEPQERDDLDRCQFIVGPFTTGPRCTHNSTIGACNSRLCGDIHPAIACATNQRVTYDCDYFSHLSFGLEASWDPFQYSRCRR